MSNSSKCASRQISGCCELFIYLFICRSCCSPQDTSCSATSVIRHFNKHRHTIMSFYSCRRPTPFHPPAACQASLFVPSSIQKTSGNQRQTERTAGGGGINITEPLSSTDALLPELFPTKQLLVQRSPS